MNNNAIELDGRVAVVTGSARGIGRAVAERMLSSGATVVLWDVESEAVGTTASELSSLGRTYPVTVDVAESEAVKAAWEKTLAAVSTVDVLVNNAGIAGPNAPTWEYPLDAWHLIRRVNLDGPFLCCRAVVPHMIERGYGRIVNIASIAGKEGNPNACAYSATKAGVIALTKSLGKELAHLNIAVNCVTPAAARTRIFDQMAQSHIDYMLSKIPRGRFADVAEIAAMVAWLASEENSFTTGAVFDLSGGRATY